MTDKKPGFFKKLFSSKSRDVDATAGDEKTNRSPSTSPTTPDAGGGGGGGGGGSAAPMKAKEKRGSTAGQKKTVIPSVKVDPPPDDKKSPTKKTAPATAAKPTKKPPPLSSSQEKARRAPTTTTTTEAGVKKQKRLSRKKAKRGGAKGDVAPADPNQRLEFPTTPEMILAIHKRKPFLDKNEEWLVVELNEYECLVENLDIIKTIATHSKFFEVEPDELWEEFFEYVEEVPSYDEVINYDVWQEFRDEKYPC